ncbi:NACHT, LRR and PYD domains-containing protein 1b allele 3-like [Engystomops pustulosus]|uniref:NACHT, LRR and PYD domains-containing protein 1b allele 3-like n=1 Tax=Engystomops pustulosus TaxID=76066 RepID=UPI003AFAEA92
MGNGRIEGLRQAQDLEADLVDPIACGGLYKLELKSPGLYFCHKTGIKFQVEAPVTIEYKLDSWSDHLKDLSYTSYEILSPLFNIQTHGESNAVSAVYLPHYLCLKGFSGDISLIQCAHFKDGNLTLETPTQIEPFYVLLKNPTFSCLGLLTALGKKKTPKHGIVLLYFKILCRGDPIEEYKIHLYTVPYTVNVEESLDQENKKFGFQRVKKYEHTNESIYTKSKYLITGHPGVLAHPKTLKFDIEPYQFTEIRLKEKTADIFLYVAEEKTQDTVWDTRLTQSDLMDVAQLLSSLTIHRGACDLYPDFVDKHRDALIQRVSDMGQILDHLLKHKLLTQEQYDNIRSIRPRQEAMRQLYGYMTIWRHCDKEKFYQALKMYNEPLVRDLEDKDTIKM